MGEIWAAIGVIVAGTAAISGLTGWALRDWADGQQSRRLNDAIRADVTARYATMRDGRNAANYPAGRYAEEGAR